MGRRYAGKDVASLEKMTAQANEIKDIQTLQSIRAELQHRSSKRAQSLAKTIDQILAGRIVKMGKTSDGPNLRTVSLLGPKYPPNPPRYSSPLDDKDEEEGKNSDSTAPNLSSWSAKKIVDEERTLKSEIERVAVQISSVSSEYQVEKDRLDSLNEELHDHLRSKYPSIFAPYRPVEPRPAVTERMIESVRSEELERLKQQAVKNWHKHRELVNANSSVSSSIQKLSALEDFRKTLERRLKHVQEFLANNRAQITSEIENDLVIEIADQLALGRSDLELLSEAGRMNYVDDPVLLMARARLYRKNVLGVESQNSSPQ